MNVIKTMEELDDELCNYCPLEDYQKGTHAAPNGFGYSSCEGSHCEAAYEVYLESMEDER